MKHDYIHCEMTGYPSRQTARVVERELKQADREADAGNLPALSPRRRLKEQRAREAREVAPKADETYVHDRYHTTRVVLSVVGDIVTCQETQPNGSQRVLRPCLGQWRKWVQLATLLVDGHPVEAQPPTKRDKWLWEGERMPWPDQRQEFYDRVMARRPYEIYECD